MFKAYASSQASDKDEQEEKKPIVASATTTNNNTANGKSNKVELSIEKMAFFPSLQRRHG